MTLICKLPAQGLIDEVNSQVAPDRDLSRFFQGRSVHYRRHILPFLFPSEGDNSLTAYQEFNDRSIVIHVTKAAHVLFLRC